ncbi:MAG TPA: response regulator [Mariprofundaceae bacterium]|nr:response regulator [Mariprofundaceae bacterium]
MNILLIDDDPLAHDLVAAFVRRYTQEHHTDVSIKALHDPVQGALELTEHGSQYDVILLDIKLPRLGGDEIYRNIAMKMPDLLNRIIVITASPHQLHEKLPDRDLRVLSKPFRYDMFEFHISDISPPRKRTG